MDPVDDLPGRILDQMDTEKSSFDHVCDVGCQRECPGQAVAPFIRIAHQILRNRPI